MELSLGALLGAMAGAALGAAGFAIIAPLIDSRMRAAAIADTADAREDLERRIAGARRGVLALDMLVFVGAGYWAGTALGG
ncbi:MAG: hypothetical protein QOG38_1825 [Hyphomicrobiales bacterium]|jgi:hypothetical protein|nr:hypothetical protein [Hyphomicrobiales bacterium]